MTSYLSFAFNPRNIAAFTRIVNVPKRGIGEVWLNRILEFDMDHSGDMLDSLKEISNGRCLAKFNAGITNKIRDLVMICIHIRSMIDEKVKILCYIKNTC